MDTDYCTRCRMNSDGEFLREIVHPTAPSLQDILRRAQQEWDSCVGRISSKYKDQRLQDNKRKLMQYERELKEVEENASYEAMDRILRGEDIDDIAKCMLGYEGRNGLEEKISSLRWKPQDISEEDIRKSLERYERQGYIEIQGMKVKITSAGVVRLANNVLQTILQSLARKGLGSHSIEEAGFGSELSAYTKRYETGDDYSLVDIEGTAINALERCGCLDLEQSDFLVHEEFHQSKLCAGLIIDESTSMLRDHKLEAAMETALALAQLIRRNPKDSLKIFVFSEQVKEIMPWEIASDVLSNGLTDIGSAMRAFSKATRNEKGDRQAYLITDTEPNCRGGRYVGFQDAVADVMGEALHYRRHNIGLNIIMLDETLHLKKLASDIAKKNLGRVFFTTPSSIGQVIVSDYFRAKRKRL